MSTGTRMELRRPGRRWAESSTFLRTHLDTSEVCLARKLHNRLCAPTTLWPQSQLLCSDGRGSISYIPVVCQCRRQVEPGASLEYAWDEPQSTRRLRCVLEGQGIMYRDPTMHQYSLDEIRVRSQQSDAAST